MSMKPLIGATSQHLRLGEATLTRIHSCSLKLRLDLKALQGENLQILKSARSDR